MKYACGLYFTKCVFEDMETANKWLEENGWTDPVSMNLFLLLFTQKMAK